MQLFTVLKQRPLNPFKKSASCGKLSHTPLISCAPSRRAVATLLLVALFLVANKEYLWFWYEEKPWDCSALSSDYLPLVELSSNASQRPRVEPAILPVTADCRSPPTVAMCTIMKDEKRYLNEWLDYNVALGFSQFYLYDNHDSATLAQFLDESRPGWKRYIQVKHWPGESQQLVVLNHCTTVQARKDNHTWVASFDADEFLVLKRHKHIVAMLMERLKEGSVSVNWFNFGPDPVGNATSDVLDAEETFRASANLASSGPLSGLPRPLLKRNQHRGPLGWHGIPRSDPNFKMVKTIAVQQHIKEIVNPHAPELVEGKRRKSIRGKQFFGYLINAGEDTAVLHHYGFKSVPEFIFKKCIRGRPTVPRETWMKDCESFRNFAINPQSWNSYLQVFDDSAWTFLTERIPWYKQFDDDSAERLSRRE